LVKRTAEAGVAGGTTTSIAARFLIELLDQAGAAPDDLLAAAAISREDLQSPELRFPVEPFDQLWSRAAQVHPDVGLSLVDRFPAGQMHIVTHLALRSVDVRAALRAVVEFARLTHSLDRIELVEIDGLALFSYRNAALDAGIRHNPWLIEHFLSLACVFLSRACGRALPVQWLRLRAPEQAPAAAYRSRFGVLPEFGAAANTLAFDAVALAWPLLSHDSYLRGILEQFARSQLPAVDPCLSEQVRDELRRCWLQGQEPTLQQTARACALGVDTLRQRLARESLSFRLLKDESRRDLARVYLSGRLSNGEIGYLLGFSEPAALQHACKRWFGASVGELRRQLRTGE
jgi:AraC-like DNA-binding protein